MGRRIKIANLTIIDTGYINPTNTGTRLAEANMANTGLEITLKAVDFKPSAVQKIDNTPPLGIYGTGDSIDSIGSEGSIASIENVSFTLSGLLDLANATDQALVMPLIVLARTKGYKALYYNSATDSAERQLIYQLASDTFTSGEASAFTVTSGLKHLHVRITSCDFIQKGGEGKWSYSLKGTVIKSETSTV